MSPLWELQVESNGSGWRGWRVTLSAKEMSATFSFDEREGVKEAHEAVRRALLSEVAQRIVGKGSFDVEVTEIRTVISAEIHPN